MIRDDYAAPPPITIQKHPLRQDRLRRAREQNLRIAAFFTGFCWGVVAALVMLVGVTVLWAIQTGAR